MFSDRATKHNAVILPKFPGLPWLQTSLPWAMTRSGGSLFHGPAYALPRFGKFRRVVTIHDFGYLKHPGWVRKEVREYLMKMVPISVRVADGIIVPTEEISKELLCYFPDASCPVAIIPVACDSSLRSNWSVEARQSDRPYILHVGTIEPRKNLGSLVRAFDMTVDRYRIPHQLILAGMLGWKDEDFEKAVASVRHPERLVMPGYVDEITIARLYQAADIYVQPSWYEGFGIGTLNAFVAGLPIVASCTGWITSVKQDSRVFLWTDMEVESLSELMFSVVDNTSTGEFSRGDLNFLTRESMARAHWDFYRKIGS